MPYTPVAQRTKSVTGAPLPPTTSPTKIPPKEVKARYVPVSQRSAEPAPAPVSATPPLPPQPTAQPGYFSPSPEGVRVRDVARELPGSIKDMATRIYQGIREPIVNPTQEQKDYEDRFIPTPTPGALEIATQPGRQAAKVITRFLNPALQPFADNIAQIKVTNELIPLVESGKMPASVFDELAVLQKTNPQIVGDVAQAVLSAYAGSQVPKVAGMGVGQGVRAAFNQGAKTGVELGAIFGTASAASSGSKDPAEILQIIADSTAGGGLLAGITAGTIPVSREAYVAARRAKRVYDKIPNKQGGFVKIPKADEPIPADLQPLVEEAKKYDTPDAFVEAQVKAFHGTNDNFRVFNPKKGAQGVVWFTDNAQKIKSGESGAAGTKYVMERYLTSKKFAGWDEYEKMGLGQLETQGFDGVKLPDGAGGNDYIIFTNKNIATRDELIKFFERAKKEGATDPLPTEARKYKSAEEFVAAQGEPVYHGTTGEFNASKIEGFGMHFGTEEQAKKIVKQTLENNDVDPATMIDAYGYPHKENVVPVYLDIKNPVTLKDPGTHNWDARDVLRQLKSKGIIDQKTRVEIKHDNDFEAIKSELKKNGYDGVVYDNVQEGEGKSYIAFDPQQIRTKDQLIELYNQAPTDNGTQPEAQNAPTAETPGPILVQSKKEVPGAIAEVKARGYTPVAKRKAPEVERSATRLDELVKHESIDQAVRRLEESAGEIEPGTPRTIEEFDSLPGTRQGEIYEKLPQTLQDEIAAREWERVYAEEIAPMKDENPVVQMVDDLLSGRRKIQSTDRYDKTRQKGKRLIRGDMRTELKEGLDRKVYSRIFTKDANAPGYDELVQEMRDHYDSSFDGNDLLDAINKRYEERIELRKEADAAKAEAKAKAKTFAEEKKLLRELQRDITREILRKRYSIGEKLKFEARAEKRGIKKGIVKGLEGKEEIRQKELKKREALRTKIHEITHTHSNRAAKVKAIAEFFSLTDKELRQVLGVRDYRLMSDPDFEGFLKSLYGKSEEVKNKSEARFRLDETIKEKELYNQKVPAEGGKVKIDMYGNVDKIRRALKMPTIENMTTADLVKFEEILSQYQKGDVFLSTRQIETIDNTELTGIRTMREARERLAKRTGRPTYSEAVVKGELDEYRWDTVLAEQSAWHQVIVEDVLRSELEGDMRYMLVEDKANVLIKKARASRKSTGVKDKLKKLVAPTDEVIFNYLESSPDDKLAMSKTMTKEELAAANYIQGQYALMRDYLLKKRVIEHAKTNYVTHIRRGFVEALLDDRPRRSDAPTRSRVFQALKKKFGDKNSLVNALEEIVQKKEQEAAIFNILDQDTGEILPLEKFFQFSMKRTGGLVPTRNVAKAFLSYTRAFEKKRALDAVIPKLVVYTKAFTPKELTQRGLEVDRSLKRFFNEWMNTKKGRTASAGGLRLKQGSNLDLLVRGGQALTRIIDLGFSIPGGVAAQLGEQTATYVNLGAKKYALGQVRAKTKQGKAITRKYQNFTGKTPFDSLQEASKSLQDKMFEAMFALYRDAYARGNKIHLLGSLTPDEWTTGEISKERLADLKLEMGRFRAIEGAESVVGATTEGSVLTQYKKWAIPAMRTQTQNLNRLARALVKKDPKVLQSREFWELFRTAQVGAFVAVMAYGIGTLDDDDKSLMTTLKKKMITESLSLMSALDPKTLTGYSRLAGFVKDLGQGLSDLIKLETTKSTGELKGLNDLQRILTPRLIKQFTPPPVTKPKGVGSVSGGPAGLPKLPSLPGLPPLPK